MESDMKLVWNNQKPLLSRANYSLLQQSMSSKENGKSPKTMSPERLQELRKVATIQRVGSSNRIEGAKLSDA